MARISVETTTKTATRRANTKSKDTEGKTKRPPSAYNLFVKEHMKTYLAENPGKTNKDAMKHVRALWKDAPENPKRGQEVKERAPKKAPKRSKKAAAEDSEGVEGPQVEPGSDE
ncbi:hypothetical protein BJY52DRAFT_1284679 [Lactarius psammicola]|nr:hypothetical protein BJY52DRAFT_1284679 [Lactarius psammicola]